MKLNHTKTAVEAFRVASRFAWRSLLCDDWLTMHAELERLQAIVGKLPVNGDGDPILPGDKHWAKLPNKEKWEQFTVWSVRSARAARAARCREGISVVDDDGGLWWFEVDKLFTVRPDTEG